MHAPTSLTLLFLDDNVFEHVHDLLGRLCPAHGRGVDLLEWMNDIRTVQGNVGPAQGRTVAGIESRVPLIVLIAEPDYRHIAVFD